MADLARAALRDPPLPVLLDLAAHLVSGALPADGCRVLELTPGGELRHVADAGSPATTPVLADHAIHPLVEMALSSAVPVSALHASVEPQPPTGRPELAGFVAVRLDAPGQPYGVLVAYAAQPRLMEPEELDLLSAVASVLAVAISHRHAEDSERSPALHDPLTGLPNRTLLWDRLGQAVELARRSGTSVGVLLADLDGFAAVNDALGHAVGDAVLVGVAERLRGAVHAAETVARMGGDEFAVCLPGPTSEQEAVAVATRLASALDRPLRLGGLSVPLSASIGVAVFPEHGTEPAAVLARAQAAMRQAKSAGQAVATYRPGTEGQSSRRMSLAVELARAIEADELELDYQPLVDLTTGAVPSAEALVRWRGPTGDILSASDLIFLAEHSGLMRSLSTWVLDRAVDQIRRWREQGIELPVAVNVSAGVLEDSGFRDEVTETLRLGGAGPGDLSLEITESVILSEHGRTAVTRLAEAGIAIAIDDFGTGYASLSYLKHLPLRQLKIDRSFVTRVAEDPRDLAIVRSVVDLGHALGLQVVVEGVEDAAAAELLRELAADLAQGYLFSRPVSPTGVASWLADRRTPKSLPARQLTLPEAAVAACP